jgi:hypothetical protein
MTPTEQTLLTMMCMGLTFWWGWREGRYAGIEITLEYFERQGMLKDSVKNLFKEEEDKDE